MGREKILIVVLGILFMVVMPVWGEVIHNAAKEGDVATIESILAEKPEKINAKDKDDLTPLHFAVCNGHKDVAELLIAKGSDVNAKDQIGETPLVHAERCSQKDLLELLIARGADVNSKDGYGNTPLHIAADRGHKDVAELLIAKGADINAQNKNGSTPLHWAAMERNQDIFKFLIAKGADANAKDKDGKTPFIVKAETEAEAEVETERPQLKMLMMSMASGSDRGMRLNIKFDYNSDRIRTESYSILDYIAKQMKSSRWQDVKFIIEGHTDERGTAEYNKLLSQRRAESTKRYLVENHGIDSDRLITRGSGEERPLNRAHNEQAWAQNRRVMLKASDIITLNVTGQGNINIIMFANTSSKNTQIRKKLSRLTSDLVSLHKSFPQVHLGSVVTDEDCTRNEVSKKLKRDKGEINIIILVGDILYDGLNRAYFKTIDTDSDILEDSAVGISQIREKLKGGQESIIVVTNHLKNYYGHKGDKNLIINEKISANPMASVETPIESQLGLLDKLIQKMKTDLSGGIQDKPLLESIISFCLETRNRSVSRSQQ
jgi:outer membrane protein OmpA-like peptidoglycan-associated protein